MCDRSSPLAIAVTMVMLMLMNQAQDGMRDDHRFFRKGHAQK
jgi:hypothetical protein